MDAATMPLELHYAAFMQYGREPVRDRSSPTPDGHISSHTSLAGMAAAAERITVGQNSPYRGYFDPRSQAT
jgi:hypothetical protein